MVKVLIPAPLRKITQNQKDFILFQIEKWIEGDIKIINLDSDILYSLF